MKSNYLRTYYQENKEQFRQRNKRYRNKNKEACIEYEKKYLTENKQKIRERQRKYLQKKRLDPVWKLAQRLRAHVSRCVTHHYNITRSYALDLLGCSFQECRLYLEKQWKEGMSWENYGQWHIDHVRPTSSFDLTIEEEKKKCFHYTNLQPLWAWENYSKNDLLPDGSRARDL